MSLRERTRPGFGIIEPCLPSPAKAPPSGAGWLHEIKHDGFRILADYLSDNGNRSRICFLPLIQFSGCFGFGFSVKFTLTAVHLTILRSVVFWGQQKL